MFETFPSQEVLFIRVWGKCTDMTLIYIMEGLIEDFGIHQGPLLISYFG